MSSCYPGTTDWGCADQTWLGELKPEVRTRSEMLAWLAIFARTGQQANGCPVTVRPCRAGCGPSGTWLVAPVLSGSFDSLGRSGGWMNPHINIDGLWVNACGCRSGSECSCSALMEVRLPGPVAEVVEVTVDGVAVAPSAYRIDNGNRLVRTDGGEWPVCQDMAAEVTEEGSFAVKYVQGLAIDEALNYAAGVLAMEFAKACTDDKSCRLPQGVTSIVRQGVSMEIVSRDPFETLLTGIMEVDQVIAAYNPYGLRSAPTVMSPDYRPARQTTWFAS